MNSRSQGPNDRWRLLLLLAPLWLLAACAGPPDNLIVLLDNEDGSTGQIEVRGPEGTQTLDSAREATGADRPGQDLAAPDRKSV